MAGFRDKDSQLVPEAEPPMGQSSSSREQSVHGREVPDENRNVKSKGTAAAANSMIIMDNKCANCSYDFTTNSSPSRAKVSDVVVPSEVSAGLSVGASAPQTVKVKYAFEYVFNIKTQDSQVDVAACSDCAQYLAGVYGLVSKLSQLRTVDSYFEKRIKHQQDLISKSESGNKKGTAGKKAKGPSVPAVKGAQYKTKKEKAGKPAAGARASATPPATPKTAAKSKKKGRGIGSELPSNIRDFIDPRPSRASKLTAMVLMNNTFEAPTQKSTPKASPSTPPPEPKGSKKAPAAKKAQKKKADEPPAPPAAPPAKKAKLSSEKPAAKARGKKAPAAAQAPPSTPVTPTGTKTSKAKITPRSSLKKSAKKDEPSGSSETSLSSTPPVVAAEPNKKGKGKGKKNSTSLEEAIAASKLSSELKIPSVPLPSPAETKGKKPKKEKAPKKPKIMLSKATSTTTKRNEDSSAAKEETPVSPPAPEEKKKATKKKPKKSENGAPTEGGIALDLSLKIPQVPIPTSGSTPKSKKSKGKKDGTDIPAQVQAPVPIADLKPKAPKKGKAAKSATSLTTKEEDTSAQAAPKKSKKGKKNEVLSTSVSSISAPPEVGNKAAATAPKFTCKSCGKVFTARWNLRRHDLLVHELPLSPPFNCNVCSQEFQARKALLEHKMSGPCASAPSSSASPEMSKASSAPSAKKSKGDDKKEAKIKIPKGPGKDSEAKKPTKSQQPKGSTIKDTKEQGGDKPAKKEKQERKRKSPGDDKSTTKTVKKSKKSENAAVGTGSNIPKGSSDSKTGASAHLNGPIESAATPQEIGSSAQDPKMTTTTAGATVGTSSSSVNAAAESVTSTPNGGGDTAGVGA